MSDAPDSRPAGPVATRHQAAAPKAAHSEGHGWPLWVAFTMLAVTGVAAAFVSNWFVAGLTPAMGALHISPTFAGLVIVAIAGNAVENVVGVQLAYRNQPDHALSVILQSPVQIAMMVAPALVLLSPLVGATFTLVLPPLNSTASTPTRRTARSCRTCSDWQFRRPAFSWAGNA